MRALVILILALAPHAARAGMPPQTVGTWESVACEMPPQVQPEGTIGAAYLTRTFTHATDGGFDGRISLYADPGCRGATADFAFAGQTVWHRPTPLPRGRSRWTTCSTAP